MYPNFKPTEDKKDAYVDINTTHIVSTLYKEGANFTGSRLSNGALAFRWGVQEAFNLALNYVLMSDGRKTRPVRAPVILLLLLVIFG